MASKPTTLTLKKEEQLIVPATVQRRAGIKGGDRLEFRVSARSITITAVEPPADKPTKAEWAAIRRGEAAIARGDSVPLTEFLNCLDRPSRKNRRKSKSQTFPLKTRAKSELLSAAWLTIPFWEMFLSWKAPAIGGDDA